MIILIMQFSPASSYLASILISTLFLNIFILFFIYWWGGTESLGICSSP
jgi:hypothetical protein